jgi:hypothetical protein
VSRTCEGSSSWKSGLEAGSFIWGKTVNVGQLGDTIGHARLLQRRINLLTTVDEKNVALDCMPGP